MIPIKKRKIRIQMTPLIDVVFILLIFFMATMSLSKIKSVTLSVPDTYAKRAVVATPNTYTFTVYPDKILLGTIVFKDSKDIPPFIRKQEDSSIVWGVSAGKDTTTEQYLKVWQEIYHMGIAPKVILKID